MQMDLRAVASFMLPLALLAGCASQSGWNVGDWCGGSCDSAAGNCRVCKAPRAYWSHGRYIHWYDSWVTQRSAEQCAEKTLKNDPEVCENPSTDFCCGYEQAFIDLANGGNGVTPPVPPQKYWKANNRSARGYQKAEQWFEGYRAGVCAAQAMGRQEYLFIPASAEAAQAEHDVYRHGYHANWTTPGWNNAGWNNAVWQQPAAPSAPCDGPACEWNH